MPSAHSVKLRPLEREDLRYVHQLDNNASVMRYWFEEPYEAFVELSDLYDKHIHDQSERRFVVECDGEKAGLVELVEINHVHRRAEFQIIISPEYQGKGLATRAAKLAMDYGFTVLNLYKMSVTQRIYGNSAEKIVICITLVVKQFHSLTLFKAYRKSVAESIQIIFFI